MAFRRRSGTSWIDVSNIRRRSGSSWVTIDTVRRRSGTSWITVYSSYTAPSGSISQLHGEYVDPYMPFPVPNSMTITANPRANVSGGTGGPYTYAWSITSGPAAIGSGASSQQCSISALVLNHGYTTGGIRCVVGDGISSVTLNGTYSLHYSGGQPV